MIFTIAEAMSSVLKANPLPLGHMMIFLMPFSLGFDPVVEDSRVSSVLIKFPDLPQVFLRLLAMIGAAFGMVTKIPLMLGLPSSAEEGVSSNGVPRVRVLVTVPHCIDDHVMLQRPDGTFFKQRVEVAGHQD